MAKAFRPSTPYTVPFFIWIPTSKTVKGVLQKSFVKDETKFFCSFKTFGGTEKVVNDLIVREDTATLETWYEPKIKANCEIEVDGKRYEILGSPENIDMRNQFMILKIRAVKGGA